jgi:hypothetical protein
MADRLQRLLLECQGFAGRLEASHEMALFWMAEMRNGHPRAQGFDPSGQGGGSPVESACLDMTDKKGRMVLTDEALKDGKAYVAAIERAWRALDAAGQISKRYQNGIPPVRQPDDDSDVWCAMHLRHEVHNPRYRGELCRACYERRAYQLENAMGDLTDEQVKHHSNPINNGRWPRQRVDPKNMVTAAPAKHSEHIARAERLQLGTAYVAPE